MNAPVPLRTPKFDWDRAREMHAAGIRVRVIAATFGVTEQAIYRVVNPAVLERGRERLRLSSAITNLARKTLCDCGRMERWHDHKCRLCANEAKTVSVRADALRCSLCEEWKPDNQFSPCPSKPFRRGRSAWCRPCAADRRRQARKRQAA